MTQKSKGTKIFIQQKFIQQKISGLCACLEWTPPKTGIWKTVPQGHKEQHGKKKKLGTEMAMKGLPEEEQRWNDYQRN